MGGQNDFLVNIHLSTDSTKVAIDNAISHFVDERNNVTEWDFVGLSSVHNPNIMFRYSLNQMISSGCALLKFDHLERIVFKNQYIGMTEIKLIIEMIQMFMTNSQQFCIILFDRVAMTAESVSYLSILQQELHLSLCDFPTIMFHNCIICASIMLSSDNFPYRVGVIYTGHALVTAPNAHEILQHCHDLVAQWHICVYEFCFLNLTIHIDAWKELLTLMNHNCTTSTIVRFNQCTFYHSPSNDNNHHNNYPSEVIESICYNHTCNHFRIDVIGLSSLAGMNLISMLLKQATNNVTINVLAFWDCAIPLLKLQDLFEETASIYDCKFQHLQRIEFLSCCRFWTTTKETIAKTFRLYSDLRLHLNNNNNNALQVLSKNGFVGIDSLETIMQLISYYPPFTNVSSLVMKYNQFAGGIISKYLNQTKLKKLNLCNTCIYAKQTDNNGEIKSLAVALQSNKTLKELDLSDNPRLDDEALLSLWETLKYDNMTLTNLSLNSSHCVRSCAIVREIYYFVSLNAIKHHKLVKVDLNPLLFPFVLEKAHENISVIYWVLRTFPNLFLSSMSCHIAPKRKRYVG